MYSMYMYIICMFRQMSSSDVSKTITCECSKMFRRKKQKQIGHFPLHLNFPVGPYMH
jgi:glutaredoxin 2